MTGGFRDGAGFFILRMAKAAWLTGFGPRGEWSHSFFFIVSPRHTERQTGRQAGSSLDLRLRPNYFGPLCPDLIQMKGRTVRWIWRKGKEIIWFAAEPSCSSKIMRLDLLSWLVSAAVNDGYCITRAIRWTRQPLPRSEWLSHHGKLVVGGGG